MSTKLAPLAVLCVLPDGEMFRKWSSGYSSYSEYFEQIGRFTESVEAGGGFVLPVPFDEAKYVVFCYTQGISPATAQEHSTARSQWAMYEAQQSGAFDDALGAIVADYVTNYVDIKNYCEIRQTDGVRMLRLRSRQLLKDLTERLPEVPEGVLHRFVSEVLAELNRTTDVPVYLESEFN